MRKFLLIGVGLLALTPAAFAGVSFPPGSGGAAPGGSSGQIQYNNGGTLGALSQSSNGDSAYNIPATATSVITTATLTTARTWTLPAASAVTGGQQICVTDMAGGVSPSYPLTIAANGSDTINPEGAATYVLNSAYQGVCLISNGSNAWVVSRNTPLSQYGFGMTQDTFNCTPQNTGNIRKSLARVRAGQGNANWLMLGDSTTFGSWGGPGGISTGDLVTYSMPNRLTQMMNTYITANGNNFLGGGVTGQNDRLSNDPRLTFGSGWTIMTSGAITAGGGLIGLSNQSTASTMAFTPTINVDTFKVWYATAQTGAMFSVKIDSGTATNTNSYTASSSGGYSSVTIGTSSVGAHTLNVNYVSSSPGANVYIIGVQAWNSQTPTVNIVTAGFPGENTGTGSSNGATFNAYGWAPLAVTPALGQDATFLQFGLNDLAGSVAVGAYKTNMQTLITQAKTSGGDVVLLPPNVNSLYATMTWQSYVEALRSLALSNNVCMIDLATRWVNYSTANTLGFMSAGAGGNQHPGLYGYVDEASAIFNVVGHP